MKTTYKPTQELQPDHNTVKIQSCKIRHKTVSFKRRYNPTKIQDKQIRCPLYGVPLPSLCIKIYTPEF